MDCRKGDPMSAALIGGLSDLWASGCVKWATGLGFAFGCPIWLFSMAYAVLTAATGGN